MTKATRSAQHRGQSRGSLTRLSPVRTNLGELIAAAFDTVGDRPGVAQLLTSREFSRAAHARFVLQ
jgi:hypothetical protein